MRFDETVAGHEGAGRAAQLGFLGDRVRCGLWSDRERKPAREQATPPSSLSPGTGLPQGAGRRRPPHPTPEGAWSV